MEIALEIVEDEETRLVNTLRSTLENLPLSRTEGCIYRVPLELRRVNEEAYMPMLVSIGPFHHGKESLQEMEVHKQRYLKDFLKRTTAYDLESYVRTLKSFEERARNCYAEDIHYSSNDFIKMMLLDGCFIVEFFRKYWYRLSNEDDPIVKNYEMCDRILRDMVLLENQLPFFILVHLFNTNDEIKSQKENSFHKIALNIINGLTGFSAEVILPDENTDQAKHMVDLCLLYYTPMVTATLSAEIERGIFLIPNASRRKELGVKFIKCTCYGVKCLLDVKFSNGNLEIPTVKFQDHTETFLRNFIA